MALTGFLLSLMLGGTALADGNEWESRKDWGGHPKDERCLEVGQMLPNGQRAAYAPYYQYQFPSLISDDREERQQWLGWYYADACATNPERVGGTWESLLVHDTSDGDVAGGVPLVPVNQALPDGVTVPDPEVGGILVPAPETLGDGISRRTAGRLISAGFTVVPGPDGKDHVLVGTSGAYADAFMVWWPAPGRGEFFLHDPAGYAKAHPETGGGIARLHLGPVNLAVKDPVLLTEPLPGGTVRVQATVANESGHLVRTNFGWRYADDQAAEWNMARSGALDPRSSGPLTLEVPARDGILQIAVNPNHDTPEHELSFQDNIAEIPVRIQSRDLILVTLDVPTEPVAPVNPPSLNEFTVSATVRNTGAQDITTEVRLYQSDQYATNAVRARKIVTLPAGSDMVVTFAVPSSAPGDMIRLVAVVDPEDQVAETSEENNRAGASVPVQRIEEHYDPGDPGGVDDELVG